MLYRRRFTPPPNFFFTSPEGTAPVLLCVVVHLPVLFASVVRRANYREKDIET